MHRRAARGMTGQSNEENTVPAKKIKYSVVVPVYNEEENVGPLAAEIAAAMKGHALRNDIHK